MAANLTVFSGKFLLVHVSYCRVKIMPSRTSCTVCWRSLL